MTSTTASNRPIHRLLRGALGTVAGVLVAGLCIASVEALGHSIYGAAHELALEDADAMAAYVAAVKEGRFPDNALHAW